MRLLKLVIWDLDETILTGILEEGDDQVNPVALTVMKRLGKRGILQALATQNPVDIIPVVSQKFNWFSQLVEIEADLGPKVKKVQRILDKLDINPLDTVFVDEDPFERDSIAAQIAAITTWSIEDLVSYLDNETTLITEETLGRPAMYRQQQLRNEEEKKAKDYIEFLHSCRIQITIRSYVSEDAGRTEELLTRTHRMNLGVLPVGEAIRRLNQPNEHHVIIAEMKDVYGDMGRCGIIHLTPDKENEAVIESLAISCRTRARGLSLAMLVGLLRHPNNQFQQYRCRYIFNGSNRPLRMLLMGTGFKPQPDTNELILQAEHLRNIELPDWVHLVYKI
jgi:FkbH-like protein